MTFTCISFSWNALVALDSSLRIHQPAGLTPVLGTSCSYLSEWSCHRCGLARLGRWIRERGCLIRLLTSPCQSLFWHLGLLKVHGLEMCLYSCKTGYNKTGEQISHHLSVMALPGGKMPRSNQTVAFSHRLFLCPLKLSGSHRGFHKPSQLHFLQENYATSLQMGPWCCE